MGPIPLRIAGVPEHFNLPWHLAMERGAFDAAGVPLEWLTVPEGTGAMCGLLAQGAIDLAVLVTEGAVLDILRGNPARIVGTYVDTPLTWGVHVGAGTPVERAGDLRCTPFAISRFNSGSHLMALDYARGLGWRPEPEDFVVVDDLPGAVQRLRAPSPLAFLWEKYTTAPWVERGALRRVDEHRAAWPAFVVVACESLLERDPEAVDAILRIVREEARALMASPGAAELVAGRYGMATAEAREWLRTTRWNTDGRTDPDALDAVGRALNGVGLVHGHFTGEALRERVLRVP